MAVTNGEVDPSASFQTPKWQYLNNILSQPGPFTDPGWEPYMMLDSAKILVIGAGGLGCEILKNLALSGFRDIHVIDMDTIDVSNLNRQFLFRQHDVGQPKATVAAKFVEKRCKGVKITPYCGKIQDKDEDYYKQFALVVCGLDSVEARRWINAKLVEMAMDHPDDFMGWTKPLIDGGTEGFKGQSRVVYPALTSCLECQLSMHAPRTQVPLCTIATIPRQPSHCIEWAHQIAWSADRPDLPLDTDDPAHITWLYERAHARAAEFAIPGVTYALTQGVVKNIIPAIASTNAIVAAACTNEALKMVTSAAPALGAPGENNYCMYTGDTGVYTYTFSHERKADCPVCAPPTPLALDSGWDLQALLTHLADVGVRGGEGGESVSRFAKPSLSTGEKSLFYSEPAALFESTRGNLKRKLRDMVDEGEELSVADPAFERQWKFKVSFRSE